MASRSLTSSTADFLPRNGAAVSYDDMRAVDLLLSLPEVDPHRIGCIGLSGGGSRSTYLAGRDARIRAAVIVAWMTTLPTTLDLCHKPGHKTAFWQSEGVLNCRKLLKGLVRPG